MRSVKLALVMAALVLAAVILYRAGLFVTSMFSGQECNTALCCQECQAVAVTGVIDGDTFDSSQGRVRLYGVDTPERGERCYDEAARRLRQLAGAQVRVESGPRARDPNGRLLYYVYTSSGESIDETLLREGLAVAWTSDGQHRDFLVRLEQEARQSGAGCLW